MYEIRSPVKVENSSYISDNQTQLFDIFHWLDRSVNSWSKTPVVKNNTTT